MVGLELVIIISFQSNWLLAYEMSVKAAVGFLTLRWVVLPDKQTNELSSDMFKQTNVWLFYYKNDS